MWNEISVRKSDNVSASSFLSAVDVLVNRPHIVNDRVVCAKVLESVQVVPNFFNTSDFRVKVGALKSHFKGSKELRTPFQEQLETLKSHEPPEKLDLRSFTEGTFVFRRRLFPKVPERFKVFEDVLLIDVQDDVSVAFIPLLSQETHKDEVLKHIAPAFTYALQYKKDEETISLEVLESEAISTSILSANCRWLEESVFKRIVKWSSQEGPSAAPLPSLSLVPVDRYCQHRQKLKDKYAKDIIEKWTETTDPKKFVHEDIAIAAYLLTLWECEREDTGANQKQSFVDLGCGNGLLVYILASEGHKGLGLDLRKRCIWDSFSPTAVLKESTLVPSQQTLFPEYDWLIGNHSDELTPWIPMIASRSSYKMRLFLLPCCAFTFDGKYQRTFPGSSQYQSFLNFVKDVCQEAGFVTQRDKLRIPSTKRVCFVCSSRSYSENEEAEREVRRKAYISKHSRVTSVKVSPILSEGYEDSKNCLWVSNFEPREKVEAVRNCTQLDRTFLDGTVDTLAEILLSTGSGCKEIKTETGIKSFQFGGCLTIGELAERLENSTKIRLKQQCGGLQTLLRNHKHIFKISDNLVCLTPPLSKSEYSIASQNKTRKKGKVPIRPRPCWFYFKHPDGCPLESSQCRFLHS